jgi:hypothetical protein
MTRSIITRKAVSAFDSPFKGFKPETEQTERKPIEHVQNKTVEKLRQIWKEAVSWMDLDILLDMRTEKVYDEFREAIRNLKYTSKDVELFSVAMAEFKDEECFEFKAGIFLSALVNNGQETEYTIHTRHLGEIPHLGFRNRDKEINVDGDCARCLGTEMSGGILRIFGNAGVEVGYQTFGGPGRTGEIHIEGDYKTIYKKAEIKIFHNGTLIWDYYEPCISGVRTGI